jgi:hypothetical protein
MRSLPVPDRRIGAGQMVRPGGAGLCACRPDPYQARLTASPGGSLRERASVVGDAHLRCPAPGIAACPAGRLDRRGRPWPRRAGAAAAEGMQSDTGSQPAAFQACMACKSSGSGSLSSLFYAVKAHISILRMILGLLHARCYPIRLHSSCTTSSVPWRPGNQLTSRSKALLTCRARIRGSSSAVAWPA